MVEHYPEVFGRSNGVYRVGTGQGHTLVLRKVVSNHTKSEWKAESLEVLSASVHPPPLVSTHISLCLGLL